MKTKNKQIILKMTLVIGIVFLLTLSFNTASATPDNSKVYVDKNGNDAWDGLSRVYNHTSGSGPKATITSAKGTLKTNGTIYIARGTYQESNIIIDKDMTIYGESQEGTIIQGINGKKSIFLIIPGVKVSINNLTLNGSQKTGNGGAIYNEGTLTMKSCTLTQNQAEEGGALYNKGVYTLDQCTLKDNKAKYGGAIYDLGNGYVTNCTFTHNKAKGSSFTVGLGGAIYNEGTLTLTRCEFTNNTADMYGGGAIYNHGKLTAAHCVFLNNSVDGHGGAIGNSGDCDIINSTFSGNKARGGGALYNYAKGILNVFNSKFHNNQALSGGAILNNAKLTVTDSRFLNNIAEDDGGAIKNSIEKSIINNCIFTGNRADYGGALYNDIHSRMIITCSVFNDNEAYYGGAIYNEEKLTVTNSKFNDNQAYRSGGAIYNIESNVSAISKLILTVNNCTFHNNTAGWWGGAIITDGTAIISNSTFTQNQAPEGGAICNFDKLTITKSTFEGNTAEIEGGAIMHHGGTFNVTYTSFIRNKAELGSAIAANGYGLWNPSVVNYSSFIENSSETSVILFEGIWLDARHNWWGSNDNPYKHVNPYTSGYIDVSDWLDHDINNETSVSLSNSTVTVNK